MDTKPDTIKISTSHREEIFASHANLYVTVKGSSIISGNEAMKKAREVSQLVEALTRYGLSPDVIQLQGVPHRGCQRRRAKVIQCHLPPQDQNRKSGPACRVAGYHRRAEECNTGADRMEIS